MKNNNKFVAIMAGVAVVAMAPAAGVVANATPRADNPNVLGCAHVNSCANRVKTFTSMTQNSISEALIASGRYATDHKFY